MTAESVAPHRYVEQAERSLIEIRDVACGEDHAHAGAPKRHPRADPCDDGFGELEPLEQTDHGRRFAARHDERIDRV